MVGRMIQLTDEMIINSFDKNSPYSIAILIIGALTFLALIIVCIIKFKKEKQEKTISRKKSIIGIISCIVIAFIVLAYGKSLLENIFTYNAISYSIENDSWYVDTDTIKRTGSSRGRNGNRYDYIVLSKYGEVPVKRFSTLVTGESVYVVIVEGRFGGTYVAQVYPTDEYIYEK